MFLAFTNIWTDGENSIKFSLEGLFLGNLRYLHEGRDLSCPLTKTYTVNLTSTHIVICGPGTSRYQITKILTKSIDQVLRLLKSSTTLVFTKNYAWFSQRKLYNTLPFKNKSL